MIDVDTSESGSFERQDARFREKIRDDEDARFAATPGRYHLYISRACPWAHGAALVRRLAGLQDVVTMDVVDPYREDRGWQFTPEKSGCTPDSIADADYLAEVYERADPGYDDRPTVPVLWDRERETIVNNESIEIMRLFADAFRGLGTNDVDLYPTSLRDEIDSVVEDLYEPINDGVYRAGFAESQAAYDRAVDDLFSALDRWEVHLADRRYLVGDRLTLADLRLFPTLVRFDHVYHTHFMCNVRRIVDYPNLWGYLRDVYQHPGVAETVNLAHIREHYYATHDAINPSGIVARGPDLDFESDHGREDLPGSRPANLG